VRLIKKFFDRSWLGIDAALGNITSSRGTHYDQQVVNTCLRLFREQGYGFSV